MSRFPFRSAQRVYCVHRIDRKTEEVYALCTSNHITPDRGVTGEVSRIELVKLMVLLW